MKSALPFILALLALPAVAQTTYKQTVPQQCCGIKLDNGSFYSFELVAGTSAFTTNVFGNYEQGTDDTTVKPVTLPACNHPYQIPTTFTLNKISVGGHTGSGEGDLVYECFHVPTRYGGTWVFERLVTFSQLTFN